MKSPLKISRKSVYGLLTAGLLSASMLTAGVLALPPVEMARADIAGLDPVRSLSPLVEKVMPAYVSVEVKLSDKANVADSGDDGDDNNGQIPPEMKHFFDQIPGFKMPHKTPQGGGRALGSGFVMSADGYVVTNNHVVSDAETVKVTFENGDSFDAKVIGTDAKTDLALLKIKSDKTNFPFVSFAKTEAKVGDTVVAVGNPYGLGGTVTRGIVSAHHRDIGNGPYDDFLQIDAAINKGNSGGPTFNLDGDVIGINTAIYSPSGGSVGIGFAIPASTASNVIDLLKTNHKVTRGWLGVQIQPVSADIAESLGLSDSKGALVNDLTADSPAKKAGVKAGDAILKVDGQDVDSDRDLAKIIGNIPPGKDVKLSIVRDGKQETVDVTLGTQPTDKNQLASNDNSDNGNSTLDNGAGALSAFGLEVAPGSNGKGMKIIKVDPKSDAADAGVKEGDVILKIAGEDVSDASSVKDALKKASGKKVLMLVKTAQGQSFITLGKDNG